MCDRQQLRAQIAGDLDALDTGPVEQRLGTNILRGELLGPEAAVEWASDCRDRGIAVGCFRPPSTPDGS